MWWLEIFVIVIMIVRIIDGNENCSTSADVIPKEYLKDSDEIGKVLAGAINSENQNYDQHLPHNVIPNITDAEKGKKIIIMTALHKSNKMLCEVEGIFIEASLIMSVNLYIIREPSDLICRLYHLIRSSLLSE